MPKNTSSKPSSANQVITDKTLLRDCPGVGTLSLRDHRTVKDLVHELREALLRTAEVSANSKEILTAVEKGIAEEVQRLLNNNATKPIGEDLQRLTRSIQKGAGNPPRQAAKTIEEDLPPLDTELIELLNDYEFSTRALNLIPKFLSEQFPTKKPLTVHDFFNAFSQYGRFDATKLSVRKGVGPKVYKGFIQELQGAGIITGTNEWEPSFLKKYSL